MIRFIIRNRWPPSEPFFVSIVNFVLDTLKRISLNSFHFTIIAVKCLVKCQLIADVQVLFINIASVGWSICLRANIMSLWSWLRSQIGENIIQAISAHRANSICKSHLFLSRTLKNRFWPTSYEPTCMWFFASYYLIFFSFDSSRSTDPIHLCSELFNSHPLKRWNWKREKGGETNINRMRKKNKKVWSKKKHHGNQCIGYGSIINTSKYYLKISCLRKLNLFHWGLSTLTFMIINKYFKS